MKIWRLRRSRSRIIFAVRRSGRHALEGPVGLLVEEAVRAGCQGHRADIYAAEVARASAALARGRTAVDAEDLNQRQLAIVPRSSFVADMEEPPDLDTPPPPPPPPPPQDQMGHEIDEDQDQDEQQELPDQEDQEDQEDAPEPEPEEPELPEEFMFDAEASRSTPSYWRSPINRSRVNLAAGHDLLGRSWTVHQGPLPRV